MMSEVKLEKVSSGASVHSESKIAIGWGSERWNDGTHEFLLKYSPKGCSVYPLRGFTCQTVVDVAVANGIDYKVEPIIDGEVVKVNRDLGERFMHAVYETIIADS